MENKFGVNDRVKILSDAYGHGGLTGHVAEVEGNDFIPHETPYKVRGFWYRASELTLIADADVIEYARHEAPVTADAGGDSGVITVTSDHGITSRAKWVTIDNFDHLFIEASSVHDHIAALQVELAAAREALEAIEKLYPHSTTYYAFDQYHSQVKDIVNDYFKNAKHTAQQGEGAE